MDAETIGKCCWEQDVQNLQVSTPQMSYDPQKEVTLEGEFEETT